MQKAIIFLDFLFLISARGTYGSSFSVVAFLILNVRVYLKLIIDDTLELCILGGAVALTGVIEF